MSEKTQDQLEAELKAIIAGSDLPLEKKTTILLQAMVALAPQAEAQAATAAGGSFWQFLMQLLVQFLPLLLRLLGGV